MLLVPDRLALLASCELYELLDRLTAFRRAYGRGNTPDAAHARQVCAAERARVQAELRRRGLPGTRAGDGRVYGPGWAGWQRAGKKR
jgi:hypothetical protein